MPADPDPEQTSNRPLSGKERNAQNYASNSALALELPFTLAGAIVAGGAIGFFLDKWLHTGPWLMIVLGGLGFVAGVREVIRRLPGTTDG